MLEILVWSRRQAETAEPIPGAYLISITEPGEYAALGCQPKDRYLRVQFSDIDRLDSRQSGQVITDQQAQEIARFVDRLPHHAEHLVIHCEHGRSRSPSVAMAVCDHLGLPRSQIGWSHPDAAPPNYLVYKMIRKALVECA